MGSHMLKDLEIIISQLGYLKSWI